MQKQDSHPSKSEIRNQEFEARPSFRLVSSFKPTGDQPQAIESLTKSILENNKFQTLLGVTGSGKTFTMANIIQRTQKPTLVISHNKTLAAQLYSEFRDFFPHNEVHYFVSYYDYYQPEAYIPQKDIYIEKDADINEDIDRLRLAATSALMSRRDVIIVASVSCIYSLGDPEDYHASTLRLRIGEVLDRKTLLSRLVDLQYHRHDFELSRGKFRTRGDVIEILPSYKQTALRIELFGDQIERLTEIDPVTAASIRPLEEVVIYPAKHFIMPQERIKRAVELIKEELKERLDFFLKQGKYVEAQRLEARTLYDLELLLETGYCKGIENYSRHLSGRAPGQRPYTLIDFFPPDFLTIVDESHVTIPQIRGMYNGDRSRKETLVEHGFRLPSALDNRPMTFEEWERSVGQILFVSATPGPYELEKCKGRIVEQIIRPTGLVDPRITVKPAKGQVPDLVKEIIKRVKKKERVLVTTLTKRLAEDLSSYLIEEGIRGRYLHSEIQTIERVEILRDLRMGKFDVIVGVNLLREGLDLPEVTLVAILDADKEGFLRSETSIIQTIGRTARNVNGEVILYADHITDSMKRAIAETERRRNIQIEYNKKHNITPATIEKEIKKGIEEIVRAERIACEAIGYEMSEFQKAELVRELENEMYQAAERLDFERAAELRDTIAKLLSDGTRPSRRPNPARERYCGTLTTRHRKRKSNRGHS